MTSEEAIHILKYIRFDSNTRVNGESLSGEACMMGIEALKEQKKGKWIDVRIGRFMLLYKCSNCLQNSVMKSKYCSNCGAKMEENNE